MTLEADDLGGPPPPATPPLIGRPLEAMGLDELATHIAALEAEIARARAMIAAKSGARAAAEDVFRR